MRLTMDECRSRLPVIHSLIAAASVIASSSNAQTAISQIEGLYRPTGAIGESWSCDPEFIGQDGGALAILDGYLEGLENRCALSDPEPDGDGIRFMSTCSAEGSEYREVVVITKCDDGVIIERGGSPIRWSRCGASEDKADTSPVGGRWAINDTVASTTQNGLRLAISCSPLTASSTFPTAQLSGWCPACMTGDEADIEISIEGSFAQSYSFIKKSNADGWLSDLDYSANWHDGLIAALRAGSVVKLKSDGHDIEAFSLTGSAAALDALTQQCN